MFKSPVLALLLSLSCADTHQPTIQAPLGEWYSAPKPWIVAHRGTTNIAAPENTHAAFEYAARLGVPIESDLRPTLDGVMVCFHDESTLRTAGVDREISSMTFEEVAGLDASFSFHPEFFSPQRIPTLDEFLDRYGAIVPLMPELKQSPGRSGYSLARAVRARRLERTVIGYSYFPDQLEQIRVEAPQMRRMLISVDPLSTEVVEAASPGMWGVAVAFRNLTEQYVTLMRSRGYQVFAWPVNSVTDAERLASWRVDGIVTGNPEYLQRMISGRTPVGTTVVQPAANALGPDWRAHSTVAAHAAVLGGVTTFTGVESVTNTAFFYLQPTRLRSADSPARQTIEAHLTFVRLPESGDTTRYAGVRFAWTTDSDEYLLGTNETSGYYFAQRVDGSVEIVRVDRGVPTVIQRAAWPPVQLGTVLPLRIDLSETEVSVTNLRTGDRVVVEDATGIRGGFVSYFGSGVVPGVAGDTVLTY